MSSILVLVLLLSSTRGSDSDIVLETDMSEYCRRRAAPSVFLGRQAPEANAHVMAFTRLAGPYSCYITVRTEPGSAIILVVQTEHLSSACRTNTDQLLVFEADTTHGGYWAAMPKAYLKQEYAYPTPSMYYTLRTKPPRKADSAEESEEENVSTSTSESAPAGDRDLAGMLGLLPGLAVGKNTKYQAEQVKDEYFDMMIDVTPRTGEKYDTSIIPLVHVVAHRINGTESGLYDLEYNIEKLSRLTTKKHKLATKYRTKKYKLWKAKTRMPFNNRNETKITKHTTKGLIETVKITFKLVDDKINKSKSVLNKTEDFVRMLQHIASSKHNSSIYLRDLGGLSASQDEVNVAHLETSMQFKNRNGYKITKHTTKGLIDSVKTTLKKLVYDKIDKSKSVLNKTEDFVRLLQHIASSKHNSSIYLRDLGGLSASQDEVNVTYLETSITTEANVNNNTLNNLLFTQSHTSSNITIKTNMYNITMTDIVKEDIPIDGINKTFTNNYNHYTDGTKTQTTSSDTNLATYDSAADDNNIRRHLEKLKRISYVDLSLPHPHSYYLGNTTKSKIVVTRQQEIPTTERVFSSTSPSLHFSPLFNPIMSSPITTVDHQSWENVVQAASKIASSLNHTPKKKQNRGRVIRKKRRIDTISLDDARPHRLITTTRQNHNRKPDVKFKNIRDFDSLLEPDNDVLSGRYRPWYVPPPSRQLFNMCYSEAGEPRRQVVIINAASLVLAINNFTMKRLTVIVTSAQQLAADEEQCPASQLECQVKGARVCVDTTSACDGVPNCGAPDIYDEDRMRCETPSLHQGKLALASITFTVVLATVIYIVHYWLKRCVPKVSDAYFVYTAGVDNVLHLDSVMKSPRYVAEHNDSQDHDTFFPAEDYIAPVQVKQTILRKFMNLLMCKCLRRHARNLTSIEINNYDKKHRYTFTELELYKMVEKFQVDASVQTGTSLEMAGPSVAATTTSLPVSSDSIPTDDTLSSRQSLRHFIDKDSIQELNLIQMMKEKRASRSVVSPASLATLNSERQEAEMQSAFYEPPTRSVTPHVEESAYSMKQSSSGKKRIRFDDVRYSMTATSSSVKGPPKKKTSVTLETGKKTRAEHLGTIEEHTEKPKPEKDAKSFWGNMKSKKKPPPRNQ